MRCLWIMFVTAVCFLFLLKFPHVARQVEDFLYLAFRRLNDEQKQSFGLHLKKRSPVAITINRAITRIQGIYDFDCQCVKRVKAFRGTKVHTKGPQSAVSSIVLEDEKRIFQFLKEIKNVLSQHTPQFFEVFKMKSLLALIVGNFLSEMSAGS